MSISLMSALLPMLTSLLKPMPSARAMSTIAASSEPDWEKKPTCPCSGKSPPNEALSLQAGAISPRQFGPIIRMPERRTMAASSSSIRRPSSPTSLKPGSNHNDGLHAQFRALANDLRDDLGGHDYHRQAGRRREILQIVVALQAEQLVGLRVDRIYRTPRSRR